MPVCHGGPQARRHFRLGRRGPKISERYCVRAQPGARGQLAEPFEATAVKLRGARVRFQTYHGAGRRSAPRSTRSQAERWPDAISRSRFIQFLSQNPESRRTCSLLKTKCHIYVAPSHTSPSRRKSRQTRARCGDGTSSDERALPATRIDGDIDPAAPHDPENFPIDRGEWIDGNTPRWAGKSAVGAIACSRPRRFRAKRCRHRRDRQSSQPSGRSSTGFGR